MTGQHHHSESMAICPAYIWMGQIVDESTHIKNNANKKGDHQIRDDRDDYQGYGYRYKVRIFGRDLQTKDLPDEALPMADVILPTTAGSGTGGSIQTPQLKQGNLVVGFYKDGKHGNEPIIIGCLPNHSQTTLFGKDPETNFVPRTGFNGKNGTKPISNKHITAAGKSQKTSNPKIKSSQLPTNEGCDPYVCDLRDVDQNADGLTTHHLPKTFACDGSSGQLKGIQKAIQDAIKFINRIKAEANSFLGAASDLQNAIPSIIASASTFITELMKTLLDKMRGYVVNRLNKVITDALNLLPPNLRPGANEAAEKSSDTLQCVFNKILRGLFKLVQSLLTQIVDKFVNAPLCAVENFVGSLLSQILGQINGALSGILSTLSGAIGQITGIVGSALQIFDIILGLLKFLSCEETLDCSMGEQWSFWSGPKTVTENVSKYLSSKLENIKNDIGSTDAPPCNTSQIPCGPPKITFSGGGGIGASGNPIISSTGKLLGVDLVNKGVGYLSSPNVTVQDDCSKGGGAVLYAVLSTPPANPTAIPTLAKINNVSTGPKLNDIKSGIIGVGTDLFSGITSEETPSGPGSGSFSGPGTYNNGSFSGSGIFVDDERTFSVSGNFAGYDSSLVGSGSGNFYGTGTYQNGTFSGSGRFIAYDTSGIGTGNAAPNAGIGVTTIIGVNEIPLTVGGVGGNPVLVGSTQVTSGGVPVVSGGSGGTNVTVGGQGGIPLSANGNQVTVNGFPVTSGAVGGIPLVINSENGTPATSAGLQLYSSGNVVTTSGPFSGLNSGKSVEGNFAGPGGSSIEKVIVIDSGVGYLPSPDGSTGGNGFVFSEIDDTILYNNTTGYSVYPPNSTIPVLQGDLIYMPPQTTGEVYDNNTGILLQTITGLGQITPIEIQKTGTITTPSYKPENDLGSKPSSGSGSYPIILQIQDVLISNPGINYSPEDKIKIIPDNGAKLTPNYNNFGKVISVNIDSTGIGFTDFPNVFIESSTGINAEIIPIFGSFRVGDLSELEDTIPEGVQVIEVVDCVGKVK